MSFSLLKKLINNVVPDMIDCLYRSIISISRESDRFQKVTDHPKVRVKLIPEVNPINPEMRTHTKPAPKVGPKRGTNEITVCLTSKVICGIESGVRTQDLIES